MRRINIPRLPTPRNHLRHTARQHMVLHILDVSARSSIARLSQSLLVPFVPILEFLAHVEESGGHEGVVWSRAWLPLG